MNKSQHNIPQTAATGCARFLVYFPLLILSACASIAQGTTQELDVRSKPEGADCQVFQYGAIISSVSTTPGTVTVPREGTDIKFICKKQNYNDAEANQPYHAMSPAFWYNFYWLVPLITFPVTIVGVVVDLSTGAYHYYDSPVEVMLTPADGTPAETAK